MGRPLTTGDMEARRTAASQHPCGCEHGREAGRRGCECKLPSLPREPISCHNTNLRAKGAWGPAGRRPGSRTGPGAGSRLLGHRGGRCSGWRCGTGKDASMFSRWQGWAEEARSLLQSPSQCVRTEQRRPFTSGGHPLWCAAWARRTCVLPRPRCSFLCWGQGVGCMSHTLRCS